MKTEIEWYAGIGSRKTPTHIQAQEDNIATILAKRGFWLRSGGALGSDTAFEYGAGSKKRIYRPHEATDESRQFASQFHPKWHKCSPEARDLLGRNPFQIMGDNMLGPNSKFVVCYTEDGLDSGGTGLAMRIAFWLKLPIFNLFFPDAEDKLWAFLNEQPAS